VIGREDVVADEPDLVVRLGRMARFAKSNSGYLSLQGDHGQVSFRNIKLLPLK